MMLQITAPHFCAAIILRKSICVQAAPILGWAVGKHESYLHNYFSRKRYSVIAVREPT